ncbi:MAG: SDR family NAD(P)-dependent oxidoreductase [Leptospiraceae bacterium]|nr:SDR family NAD(P)-dependent oxidoreductase [Leptospiraceae bacterium]
MELKDSVVVVTGSAAGLGKAMLQRMGQAGAKCIVSDVNAPAVASTLGELKNAGIECSSFVCNVTSESEVEQLCQFAVQQYGRLDVVVANAGILRDGLLIKTDRQTGAISGKMSLKDWQAVIDVNLTGVFLTVREAACQMISQKQGGVIIPISSISRHGFRGQSNYSASKAGVAAMVPLWAEELARYKIRVAGIAPGFIATEMVLAQMNERAREAWEARIPIGRLGQPDEIAKSVEHIITNDLINGVILEVSGGVRV